MYTVGRRPIRMNDGSMRYPGDSVPEAKDWKDSVIRAHMSAGTLVFVGDVAAIKDKFRSKDHDDPKWRKEQEENKERVKAKYSKPKEDPEVASEPVNSNVEVKSQSKKKTTKKKTSKKKTGKVNTSK